jgi:uncharacterized membrane protein YvbJ
MPGVNKNDIYKFCGHCGQELNKDGICEQCGSSVIFPGIRESNQKQDKNSGKWRGDVCSHTRRSFTC